MKLRLFASVVTALVLVLIAVNLLSLIVNANRVVGALKSLIVLEFPANPRTKIDYLHNAKRVSEMKRPPVHALRYGQPIPWPKSSDSISLIPLQADIAIISCCFGECYQYPKLDKSMHAKVLNKN